MGKGVTCLMLLRVQGKNIHLLSKEVTFFSVWKCMFRLSIDTTQVSFEEMYLHFFRTTTENETLTATNQVRTQQEKSFINIKTLSRGLSLTLARQ